MPQPSENTAADISRRRFEEPRRGEILVHFTPAELRERSRELAETINRRRRLVDGAKEYLRSVNEQKRDLDEQIEVMSLEVEYGQHWIPAQQQLAGLYGAFEGGAPRTPLPVDEPEAVTVPRGAAAVADTANGKRRGRRAANDSTAV